MGTMGIDDLKLEMDQAFCLPPVKQVCEEYEAPFDRGRIVGLISTVLAKTLLECRSNYG